MATFGKTTIGGTIGTEGHGLVDAYKYTMNAENGTATGMSVYVAGGSSSQKLRTVIYANSSGVPGALLATSSDEQTVASGQAAGWVNLTLSLSLTASGVYWLTIWAQDQVTGFSSYWDVGSAGDEYYKTGQTYTSPPGGAPADPFPASPTSSNSNASIYVTYTPATAALTFDYPRTSRKPMPMLRGPDRDRIGKLTLR